MKYILLFVVSVVLFLAQARAQAPFGVLLQFEDTLYYQNIRIPLSDGHSPNIWQVGKPHKKVFDSGYHTYNVLVTDTLNPYPANDTSVFIVAVTRPFGASYPRGISTQYYIDTDSLKAYWKLELSPNNGRQWHDILTDTLLSKHYKIHNYVYDSLSSTFQVTNKLPFTGNSHGWGYFIIDIDTIFHQIGLPKDTLLARFTFISDSTHSSKDGLMFFNMRFYLIYEGINEIPYTLLPSTATPNPAHDALTITYNNKNSTPFTFKLCDATGRVVQYKEAVKTNKMDIDLHALPAGIYYYSLTNTLLKLQSSGKFVKE